MSQNNVIICRCEDVTLKDIRNLLDQGYTSMDEIKRILRIGMGPCQGTTCSQLLQREISNYLKIPMEAVKTPTIRPLTSGVRLDAIKEGAEHES